MHQIMVFVLERKVMAAERHFVKMFALLLIILGKLSIKTHFFRKLEIYIEMQKYSDFINLICFLIIKSNPLDSQLRQGVPRILQKVTSKLIRLPKG